MKGFRRIGRALAYPVVKPAQFVQRKVEQTMTAAVLGIVRHLLTTGGGMFLSGDDLSQAVGAVMTLIGIGWSLIEKRQRGA